MSWRRTSAIARRLLQGFRRDRRTLILTFVAPIVIIGLLGWLMRGSGGTPKVGVANEDSGPLGTVITAALRQSSLVKAVIVTPAAGESGLKDGSLAAYIVFPADFSLESGNGILAPEVHLEGSQPGQRAVVLEAIQESAVVAASQVLGRSLHFSPQLTYLYGGPEYDTLDYFGAAFIGFVVFFIVFIVTIVSFLNERSQGTLARLMASPLRRGEIVLGYMLGFTALALIQAAEVLTFALGVLQIRNQGNVLLIFAPEAVMALVAVNLGIFLSVFAQSEFQAVQFIPLVVVPMVLLSGIVFPVASEPRILQPLSNALPLTYAVDGMRDIMVKGADFSWPSLRVDFLVVTGFCVLLIAAASATLRRRMA